MKIPIFTGKNTIKMVGFFRTRQKGDLLVFLEGQIHTTKKEMAQRNFDV